MARSDNAVVRRLRSYWRLEAGNVILVPGMAALLVWQSGGGFTVAFCLAALACAALLVIGAVYWRAVLHRMEGESAALDRVLPGLARAELWSGLMVVAALLAVALDWLPGGGWTPSRIGAAALAALAVLEYVNYYRVQLQHFDNAADFRRLISGRGLRKAHMARDIAAWRATTR